jgi:hypothetical protein
MEAENADQQMPTQPVIFTHYIEAPFMNILGHLICEERMNV